jgi:hypothetical protein
LVTAGPTFEENDVSTERQQRPPNVARVAAASALLLLLFAAVCVAAGLLPRGAAGAVLAFAAGLLVTPFVASPFEWLVHRYVYHRAAWVLRRIHTVHLAHHHLYFPVWRYVTGGPARRIPVLGRGVAVPQGSAWGNAATYLAHFCFYMTIGATVIWLPAWLLSHSIPFLAGTLAGTAVISNLFITVHDAIHRPGSHPLTESQGWFRFLDEHHYVHHVDTEANVNFLLPLADLLYGTLRRRLTEEELARHGTREAAKSRVVGAGEPARESWQTA